MNELFDSPSATLRWLEMPEGQMFLGYISTLLDASRRQLEKESEPFELYRRQGKVEVLKMVFNLPNELKDLIQKKGAS